MIRKIFLPLIAAMGVFFAITMVVIGREKPPEPPIEFPPPTPPYTSFIAGAGVVEASSENIEIGAPFPEIVSRVFVHSGVYVKPGAPLFSLDTSQLQKKKKENEDALLKAMNEYTKMLHEPRREEVPPAVAAMEAAKAEYENALDQYKIIASIADSRALSKSIRDEKRNALAAAKARFDEAKGNLTLLQSGAWVRDLEIQKAAVTEAESRLESTQNEIRRSTIRAPFEGRILQMNARVGELTSEITKSKPLLIFGVTNPLYIRVDIDQDEAWRFEPNTKATAFVRGNSKISIPLEYVRTEPLVIPKKSYTGDSFERIDTRVLQAVYKFNPKKYPVYVGLIMDVYIEAKPIR